MKFTHFRNLLVAGSMSGLFGSLYYCGKQPAPASDVKPAAVTQAAQPELARGVTKGILHKNTVARKMSRLSSRVKAVAKV